MHLLLHRGEIIWSLLWSLRSRLGEPYLPVRAGNEHPVDYTAVEVDMCIRKSTEMAV